MTHGEKAHLYEASPRDDFDLNPRREAALDFPERDLADMGPGDYGAIGFLGGLEVHQQLHTRSKLFCRCPAGRRVSWVDQEVLRHMRPTLSELGKYDACALMEFKTRKDIVYHIERGSVCTYEIDDTPPFEIDPEAVDIAIEIALLCELQLVSELHVMRKQYLDGSIPAGFQRTALVGAGGAIPFRAAELGLDRELRIRQLSLEEDSCREVSNRGHRIAFRTDRLGTPLTETVTEPDLYTPHELQAGARLLAATARVSGKVRRGAGAARQDVNVSIAGGRRVELKGVGHHRGLPLLVHIEAFRQLALLRLRAELGRRGLDPGPLAIEPTAPVLDHPLVVDAASLRKHLESSSLAPRLRRQEQLRAVRLPGFRGVLATRTQPGREFAHEIGERLRVIACLNQGPCLVHDQEQGSGVAGALWRELRGALRATGDDALVVVAAPRDDIDTAAREVLARAAEAFQGVPSETRTTWPDMTSGFERILPGPERMYPDTDTPPLAIRDERVKRIAAGLAERPWQAVSRYRALGLEVRLAERLAGAPWAPLFDALAPGDAATARRLAFALEKRIPCHRRRDRHGALPEAGRLAGLVRAVEEGEVRPEAFEAILDRVLAEPGRPAEELLAEHRPDGTEPALVAALVERLRGERGTLRSPRPGAVRRWAMGQVMPLVLGRLGPGEVAGRLAPVLEEPHPAPSREARR